MSHQWSDSEIKKILKVRLCSQGHEYFIAWKNGERSTWELRQSFDNSQLFDEFDKKIRKKRAQNFPIFIAQQKYQQHEFHRRLTGVSQTTPFYRRGIPPQAVTGCVEISGVQFALVEYADTFHKDLVKWSRFKKQFPEIAAKFIESRCLQEVLSA